MQWLFVHRRWPSEKRLPGGSHIDKEFVSCSMKQTDFWLENELQWERLREFNSLSLNHICDKTITCLSTHLLVCSTLILLNICQKLKRNHSKVRGKQSLIGDENLFKKVLYWNSFDRRRSHPKTELFFNQWWNRIWDSWKENLENFSLSEKLSFYNENSWYGNHQPPSNKCRSNHK